MDGFEIFLVDDDAGDIEISRLLIERRAANVTITGFDCAQAALDELRRRGPANTPDLLLVDVFMPVVDGFAFLAESRAIGVDAPMGVLTGSDDRRDRARAFDSGADFYVLKPLDARRLAEIGETTGAFSTRIENKTLTVEAVC